MLIWCFDNETQQSPIFPGSKWLFSFTLSGFLQMRWVLEGTWLYSQVISLIGYYCYIVKVKVSANGPKSYFYKSCTLCTEGGRNQGYQGPSSSSLLLGSQCGLIHVSIRRRTEDPVTFLWTDLIFSCCCCCFFISLSVHFILFAGTPPVLSPGSSCEAHSVFKKRPCPLPAYYLHFLKTE